MAIQKRAVRGGETVLLGRVGPAARARFITPRVLRWVREGPTKWYLEFLRR